MPRRSDILRGALAGAMLLLATPALAQTEPAALYGQYCATCHGSDRLGGQGPALLPENLGRLSKDEAVKVITEGRPSTQMPGFAEHLNEADVAALAAFIHTPLPEVPRWGEAEIEASRIFDAAAAQAPGKPVFTADPLNLFVVVESGDHHVTILDGDTFEPIYRFPSRFALHGGPKFSPDGRFVYFASRDGWISKFDIYNLTIVAEVRAGINTRNLAISADGRFLAVANYLPHSLVLLDAADLSVRRVIPATDRTGTQSSRVSAVYQAQPRNSFVVALKDVPEIWEISTDENAPPVYAGLVHSYEPGMVEALPASEGLFALRRIAIDAPLDDFFFDPDYRNLLGSTRDGSNAVVVNLTVGRQIATVDLPGLPHLGSGITWPYQERMVMATPHLKDGKVSIIDMTNWRVIKTLQTDGPGFFMRSHENTPYAWVDVFFGPHKDEMQIIDKRTLEIVRTLRPKPGKTTGHVEFTRDGRFALVSLWEMDGALIVYDAATFEEVKRIPMCKPSGKYNVYNKITLSAGTSH